MQFNHYLKILSRVNSLIANNNKAEPYWKLKATDVKSLKY